MSREERGLALEGGDCFSLIIVGKAAGHWLGHSEAQPPPCSNPSAPFLQPSRWLSTDGSPGYGSLQRVRISMVKSVISRPPFVLPRKTGICSSCEVLMYQLGYRADSNSTLSLISFLLKINRLSIFFFDWPWGSNVCSETERKNFWEGRNSETLVRPFSGSVREETEEPGPGSKCPRDLRDPNFPRSDWRSSQPFLELSVRWQGA